MAQIFRCDQCGREASDENGFRFHLDVRQREFSYGTEIRYPTSWDFCDSVCLAAWAEDQAVRRPPVKSQV